LTSDNNQQRPISVVQITDTHLGKSTNDSLLGLNTQHSLNHVLSTLNAQAIEPDLLLATGDISNDGSAESYQRFADLTESLAEHRLWLPGNHDHFDVMQSLALQGQPLRKSFSLGSWAVIMLNSQVPRQVGGSLDNNELTFLKDLLEGNTAPHVLICMHHHPINIGCAWLDEQKVDNAAEFFDLIDSYPQVKGVLWGHIHQAVDQVRNNVKLMASPSTCIQFAPNSDGFKLDPLNPGFRHLSLHGDGHIETEIHRVEGVSFDIDYQITSGY